jgi:hypothetical protein
VDKVLGKDRGTAQGSTDRAGDGDALTVDAELVPGREITSKKDSL